MWEVEKMSRLLRANILRLRKNKCFWGSFIFMVIVGAYLPFMNYTDMNQTGFPSHLEDSFFTGCVFAAIILSVFCSLFFGTEYSDGTVRNKIMVGHKRIDIYLANLITSMLAGFVLCLAFFLAHLCVGLPLFGQFETDLKIILLFTIIIFVLIFAFSAFFTMIAMMSSNKAVTAVICTLSIFLLIIVGTYLNARLNEPKNFSSVYQTEEGFYESDVPNPNYLEGTEREVYQFFYDFIPGGQLIQCTTMTAENPQLLMVYSLIIFAVSTSLGLSVFRQKDIK